MSNLRHPSLASLRPVLIGLALALVLCGNAAAQCDSLNNGNFNVGTNWTCGFVPGPTNTVRIFHTITSTTDIGVDALDIFPGGTLVMSGFPLEIEVQIMVVHNGGLLTGGANSSIYITSPPGLPFDITNDGTIQAGATGGDIFIHDGGPGGDLPCPSGSRVTASNGTFRAAPPDGNVYILADQVDFVDTHVEAGSGNVPYNFICNSVAGSVYIAGVTVILDGNTQIYQGLNSNTAPPPAVCGTTFNRDDGSVNILALSCNGTGGTLNINGNTVVGHPLGFSPSQCATVFGTFSVIAGTATINGPGTGCIYWDPPLLTLADDATLKANDITVAGEDLDASGLAGRTVPTPALDATDTLEIRLEPGGELNLQGLDPGFDYFQAGQIVIAADEDQILTDPGVGLEELMSPAPELVPATDTYVVSFNPDSHRQVTPGSSVEHPMVVSSLSTDTGLLTVYIEDSKGWLQGGPMSISVNADPGESILRTLTINVPSAAAPGDFTVLKAAASINGGSGITSVNLFEVSKTRKGRGSRR